jgi:diaminopimelate decarboxylase
LGRDCIGRCAIGEGETYTAVVRRRWSDTRIWDYLKYDAQGYLWISDLRVADAIEHYGTPLEIVDTRIIARRVAEWRTMAERCARDAGYSGRLGYLYAGKANMAAEIVCAAVRAGWGLESSAAQELEHFEWLRAHGLVPHDLPIVCNGFKLPRAVLGGTVGDIAKDPFLPDYAASEVRDLSYAERILQMAANGWNITPILDSGEFAAFTGPGAPKMNVGLRLKFGNAGTLDELAQVISRFGMSIDEAEQTANDIDGAPNLTLTTLHAMVGAAETIPVDQFVRSIALAARIWCDVKSRHPSLRELNIGGGVPPLAEPYDHAGFLAGMFRAVVTAAGDAGVPPPDVTFELGSLVASEAGFHVFKVVQRKSNDVNPDSPPWAIVDGGLMAAIPDMLLIGKPFRILAATQGVGGGARSAPGRCNLRQRRTVSARYLWTRTSGASA